MCVCVCVCVCVFVCERERESERARERERERRALCGDLCGDLRGDFCAATGQLTLCDRCMQADLEEAQRVFAKACDYGENYGCYNVAKIVREAALGDQSEKSQVRRRSGKARGRVIFLY